MFSRIYRYYSLYWILGTKPHILDVLDKDNFSTNNSIVKTYISEIRNNEETWYKDKMKINLR